MTEHGPRVVLVEPQNPANIGFIARVLANFGAGAWTQLGGPDWRGTEAERTGAAARDRLTELQRVDTWPEAVADCTHLIAFTARSGKYREVLPLQKMADLRAEWGRWARVGLVFGREDRGLESDEVDRCTACITIPTAGLTASSPTSKTATTSDGLTSLNLSHAVAIALYEWNRADDVELGRKAPTWADTKSPTWADTNARRRLLRKLQLELDAVEFPSPNTELADLLRRLESMPVETRDIRVLERMIRHARHRRGG